MAEGLRLGYIVEVGLESLSPPAHRSDFLDCRARAVLVAGVMEHHIRTLSGEFQRSFPADTRSGPSHQHPFGDRRLIHVFL